MSGQTTEIVEIFYDMSPYIFMNQLMGDGWTMMDLISSHMKLVATRLKPLGPDRTMRCAVEVGTILARELNPEEQEIIGNAFLVIGHILIRISQYHHDDSENQWQQAREIQIERSEIEMELQKLQQRVDKLAERANSSSEG